MGVVYQCKDEQLLRDVAIKMLLPELMSDKNSVEIFHQEARFAAKLEHPNIVTVFDIGVEEQQKKLHHFVSMEYLPGGNLADRMSSGALNIEHCLNWMKQLASGLSFAHKNGVIHQDIKADNIFITNEGDLKIGDFGLARLLVGRAGHNAALRGMGTPAYMSPELCRGEIQDHRSDIYSLGVLFFEMCTGQLPYRAKGMIEMATKHSSAPIPSASRLNSEIPEQLDKMLRKMMAKTPDLRYQSSAELITLLDDLIFERRVARLGLVNLSQAPGSSDKKESIPQATQGGTTSDTFIPPAPPIPKVSDSATVAPPAKLASSPVSVGPKSSVAKSEPLRRLTQDKGKSFVKTKNGLCWTFQTEGPLSFAAAPLANKEESMLFVTSSDGQISAVEIKSGRSVWQSQTNAPLFASAAISGSTIITANTSGTVRAHSISDGSVLWTYDAKSAILATPTPSSDVIYIATKDGRVIALDSQSGKLKWINQGTEPIVCPPSIHANMLLVGTKSGTLCALSLFDGRTVWKFKTRSPIVASPAASVDSVYFGTTGGDFYALDAQAGDLIWEYQTDKPIVAKAVIAFTSVIFASHDKWLYCCEKYDGRLKWKAAIRGKAMANLVVDRESIFASTQEGFTQMFNTKTGALIWQKDHGLSIESAPLVTDHYFFQGTVEGNLLAYERAKD